MSDPRFQPRLMAVPSERYRFGKVVEISWLEGSTKLEGKQIATARLQHDLAVKIMRRLRNMGQNIRGYAELADVSYDRMAKVLRGEALMRLEDVTDAEQILGVRAGLLPDPVGAAQPVDAILRRQAARKLLSELMAAEFAAAVAAESESNPSSSEATKRRRPKVG